MSDNLSSRRARMHSTIIPKTRTPRFVRQHERYTAFMFLTLTSSTAREPHEDTSIEDIVVCADNGGTTMVPNSDQYLKKSKSELAPAPSYPNTIKTSRNPSSSLVSFSSLPRSSNSHVDGISSYIFVHRSTEFYFEPRPPQNALSGRN
ncbi:hypothetical protein PM082_007570 [Marasmius tenuissimus]|nr:hypothetical protein PM082_007570 [Marasmius tenuissimus]